MALLFLIQSLKNSNHVFAIQIKLRKLMAVLSKAKNQTVSQFEILHYSLCFIIDFKFQDLTGFRLTLAILHTMVIISKQVFIIMSSSIKKNLTMQSEEDVSYQINHFCSLVEIIGSQTKILPQKRNWFQQRYRPYKS